MCCVCARIPVQLWSLWALGAANDHESHYYSYKRCGRENKRKLYTWEGGSYSTFWGVLYYGLPTFTTDHDTFFIGCCKKSGFIEKKCSGFFSLINKTKIEFSPRPPVDQVDSWRFGSNRLLMNDDSCSFEAVRHFVLIPVDSSQFKSIQYSCQWASCCKILQARFARAKLQLTVNYVAQILDDSCRMTKFNEYYVTILQMANNPNRVVTWTWQ